MKKMLLVLLLVFAVTFAANAQTTFGITGGINLSKVTGDDVDDEDLVTLLGIAGGVFANMPLGEGLAFRPELLYAQKGAKWEAGDDWMKNTAAYIEVPLLLQYTIAAGDAFGIMLMGGGYFGYLLSAKAEWDVAGWGSGDEDIKDVTKDFDFGILFGVGVVINEMIEIMGRYSMGMTTLDDPEIGDAGDIKNTAIEVRAGFRFGGN